MRILGLLTTTFLLATSAGCMTGDAGSEDAEELIDWRSGDGKQDGQTCEFDSMSAATFYGQFAYSAYERSTGTYYRIGTSWNIQPTLSNGDRADIKLYFLPSDRVIVEYRELHGTSSSSEVLNQTLVVTRATYNESTREITIAGVGKGTPLTVRNGSGQCGAGIVFQYTGDLRTAGLAGASTEILSAYTSARVIDPDNLSELPEQMREWFEEDVASGKIVVLRK